MRIRQRIWSFSVALAIVFAMFLGSAFAANGRMQGKKVDETGNAFVAPGATLSIRKHKQAPEKPGFNDYGPTVGPSRAGYELELAPGVYELGMQIPDGFDVSYSVGKDAAGHPHASFIPYSPPPGAKPVVVNLPNGGRVDVQWRFTPQQKKAAGAVPVSQTLTCNVAGVPLPIPATDYATFEGSEVSVKVGINRDLGGVGVYFEMITPRDGSLEIVDAISAGGAGWQTTVITGDKVKNQLVAYNQGAGNSARNWGYRDDFAMGKEVGLQQRNWVPLYSDHFRTEMSFASGSVNTSPCYNESVRLGDGNLRIIPEKVKVGNGHIVRIVNNWNVRFANAESYTWYFADQAMYMSLKSAKVGGLKVYYVSGDGSTVAGPVNPLESFTAQKPGYVRNVQCDSSSCFLSTQPVAYAVLVWNVGSKRVAMAIKGLGKPEGYQGILQYKRNAWCKDADCGDVQWHSYVVHSQTDKAAKTAFQANSVEKYAVQYDVGTVEQLVALGYKIPR